MTQEALKLALEALVSAYQGQDKTGQVTEAITAIKEALTQPETDWEAIAADQAMTIAMMLCEQEPVAWQVMVEHESMKEFPIKDMAHDWCVQEKLSGSASTYWIRPLYTSPPQRKWATLTEKEILDLFDINNVYGDKWIEFARSVEAKLKEKNT